MTSEYKNPHLLESWPKFTAFVPQVKVDPAEHGLMNVNDFEVGQMMMIVAVNRATGEVYFKWITE